MSDEERGQLKALIVAAFSSVERPGNWALRASEEGDEAYRVAQAFEDKADWRTLEASFLDQAPDGLASALSFFSDEAFRYFLPAYLLADLDRELQRVDVVFHLCHGLDDKTRGEKVNARRYGDRTWFDTMRHRFSGFTAGEAGAIAAYLEYKLEHESLDFARGAIEAALRNYWRERAGGPIEVRPVSPGDVASWLPMRQALWPEASEGEHREEIDRFFAGAAQEPLAVLLAVDSRGRAVGFAELSIRPCAEGCQGQRVAYLEGWFVLPGSRRHGVGRALVKAAEEWGRSQGCAEFASDTQPDNDTSAAAHRALGFTDVGLIRCFRKDL